MLSGCMTPTEIIAAEKCRYKINKIVPGNVLKPVFLSSIRKFFQICILPTLAESMQIRKVSSHGLTQGLCRRHGQQVNIKGFITNRKL